MGKSITRAEYLQLVGLYALARRHDHAVSLLMEEACAITGERADDSTYTAEFIYGSEPVEDSLRSLQITVDEGLYEAHFMVDKLIPPPRAVKEGE